MKPLDLLVIAAHPDDAELSCGGFIAKAIQGGKEVGILDLTQGEMGTRGTPKSRSEEAKAAGEILGLRLRENLGLADAFFTNDKDNRIAVARAIRHYRPQMLLLNAPFDRHPDHGRASELVRDAIFVAGLKKVVIEDGNGNGLEPWRPATAYHFIQSVRLEPDIIVDVSETWEVKMNAIRAYKSQFYDPNSEEPETYISSPEFMHMIEARGKEFGHSIGVPYGEGFIALRKPGVANLFDLI